MPETTIDEIAELHREISAETVPPVYLTETSEVSEYLHFASKSKLFLTAMHKSSEIEGLIVYI